MTHFTLEGQDGCLTCQVDDDGRGACCEARWFVVYFRTVIVADKE
jgi:hypothetical protein